MTSSYQRGGEESLRPSVVMKHGRDNALSYEQAGLLRKRLDRIETQCKQFFEEDDNVDPTAVPTGASTSTLLDCTIAGDPALSKHDGKTLTAIEVAHLVQRCNMVESLITAYRTEQIATDMSYQEPSSSSASTIRTTIAPFPTCSDTRGAGFTPQESDHHEGQNFLGRPAQEEDWSDNGSYYSEHAWDEGYTPTIEDDPNVHPSLAYFISLRTQIQGMLPDKTGRRTMMINAIRYVYRLRYRLSSMFRQLMRGSLHNDGGCNCDFCHHKNREGNDTKRSLFGRGVWRYLFRRRRRFG